MVARSVVVVVVVVVVLVIGGDEDLVGSGDLVDRRSGTSVDPGANSYGSSI